MRTKLRLDLKDVRKQIEDMEELLKSDKSAENVEAHQKLVDYEEKLKDQYQKMTGLSVDQASNLEDKYKKEEKKSKSKFALLLGFLGGMLVSYGFYNTLLHSIVGFGPMDVLGYFTGTGGSTASLDLFVAGMIYGNSLYLIVGPLLGGALFVFLGSILDRSRSFFPRLLEGTGFLISVGLMGYVLFGADTQTVTLAFLGSILLLAATMLAGGALLSLASFSNKGGLSKISNLLAGILFIYSGAQLYLLTMLPTIDDKALELVYQWPWIIIPVILGAALFGINRFFRLFR
ncbi:MAG: hypothetical protein ACXAE3_17855 [Candidatus Kariarchaeaceae archaeon]